MAMKGHRQIRARPRAAHTPAAGEERGRGCGKVSRNTTPGFPIEIEQDSTHVTACSESWLLAWSGLDWPGPLTLSLVLSDCISPVLIVKT